MPSTSSNPMSGLRSNHVADWTLLFHHDGNAFNAIHPLHSLIVPHPPSPPHCDCRQCGQIFCWDSRFAKSNGSAPMRRVYRNGSPDMQAWMCRHCMHLLAGCGERPVGRAVIACGCGIMPTCEPRTGRCHHFGSCFHDQQTWFMVRKRMFPSNQKR